MFEARQSIVTGLARRPQYVIRFLVLCTFDVSELSPCSSQYVGSGGMLPVGRKACAKQAWRRLATAVLRTPANLASWLRSGKFSEHETMPERRSRRVLRKHAGEGRVIHLVRRMTSVGEGYRLRDARRRLSQQTSDKALASYVARSTPCQGVSHAACSQQCETGSGQSSCDVMVHGATASP